MAKYLESDALEIGSVTLTNATIFRPDLWKYYYGRQIERPDYIFTCHTYVAENEYGHCCTLYDATALLPLNSCTEMRHEYPLEDYTYQDVMRRCVQNKIDKIRADRNRRGESVRDFENLLEWIEEGGDCE